MSKLRFTGGAVAVAALMAGSFLQVFADSYEWVGGANGSWTAPASFSPNGTPGAEDTVTLPDGVTQLDASDAQELAAVNAIGRIVPSTGSVFRVDVPSGDAALYCAFTRSANAGEAAGTLRKVGAGTLTLTSKRSEYVEKSINYDYYAGIEVAEGTLMLPQSTSGGDAYRLGVLTVSNNATFFTLSTPSVKLTYTQVMGLCGGGVITNSADASFSTGQVLQPVGLDLTEFSGKICCPVRWTGRGKVNLTGTENTMISTFNQAANGGKGEGGVAVGVMSFGRADGTPSSVGVAPDIASRDEGAAFVYLGTGETTDKSLTVNTDIDKPQPTYLSGGEHGGLVWTGLWMPNASAQMQQLVICGDGGTNFMRGAIQRRSYNGTNYTFCIRKAGKGTWRIEDGSKGNDLYYQMHGGWVVEEGTLQFTSISETNFISSLGVGLDHFKDVGGRKLESNRVSYGFKLGGDETEGTLEYVGAADDICTERPIWLYGDGAFRSDGEAKIRFRGVSSVTPEESPAVRAVTFTLKGAGTGENEVLDITDSTSRPVSVVKEGVGTWVLGGEQSFHGMLEVKDGLLVVRRPEKYRWHRWMLTSQENAASAIGFQLQEFGLFDAQGMRRNCDLTLNADHAALQPGQVAYGTDKIAVPSTADRNIDKLFDDYKSDYGYYGQMRAPNATSGTQTPVRSDQYSWFPIVMRLPSDAPDVVMYDTIFYQATTHARSPTSYFIDGSVDGVHWKRLSTMDAFESRGANTWYWNNEAFGAGGKRNQSFMNGCAIDAGPATLPDVLNNAKAVSVAAGATLAAEGNIALPGLAVDCSAGCGTISNFTFAANGAIYLTNVPDGTAPVMPGWTMVDCRDAANVSAWTVHVDGVAKPRWRAKASADGAVYVLRAGICISFK